MIISKLSMYSTIKPQFTARKSQQAKQLKMNTSHRAAPCHVTFEEYYTQKIIYILWIRRELASDCDQT